MAICGSEPAHNGGSTVSGDIELTGLIASRLAPSGDKQTVY
jgi:hypothetical protein